MSAEPMRLLVVEDEENLAAGLKLNFELEGYQVAVAGTAREAGNLLLSEGYDAIILDVMLPDIDGFKLCQKLRDSGNVTPVLMLTARGGVEDRVEGLNVGADDYLTKPFELSELIARVRSLIRRRGWERATEVESPTKLRLGNATIDFDKLHADVGGEQAHLTKLEFDLLQDYPNRRMVDNFIMRLRRHFEPDPSNPRYFLSVRGAGYKFVPPA
jgi:DNA-binding response OmpR family regulator